MSQPDGSRADLVTSSLLHLMSRYASAAAPADGQRELAGMIERHLDHLAAHDGLSPVLRATCQRLAGDWQARQSATLDEAPPQRGTRLRALLGLG
jgi:predicted secreted protein